MYSLVERRSNLMVGLLLCTEFLLGLQGELDGVKEEFVAVLLLLCISEFTLVGVCERAILTTFMGEE